MNLLSRLREAFVLALQVPIRNPGRSALTALGLAIGVGAFIAMVSFGRGARSSVVTQFEALGSNLLKLRTAARGDGSSGTLTREDVDALLLEGTTFKYVAPFVQRSLDISYEGRSIRTAIRGSTPDFARTKDEPIVLGGLFDTTDLAQSAKVCVLGFTPVRALFQGKDPLGAVVTIGGRLPCRVIGVLAERGAAVSGSDLDDRAMIPLSTFQAFLGDADNYSWVEVRPADGLLPAARKEVTDILRRRHHLAEGANDDFNIQSPDEVTRVAEQIGGILTGLLAGIAGVSLLVGGIGIMNIQLVSVAERTHEIGIRAAIGASPSQILRQFLAEAVVLACIGVGAGVTLGVAVSVVVAKQMGWPVATSPDVVIGAAAFGVFVGTLFGYIPAKRAADMDPIDALRRE